MAGPASQMLIREEQHLFAVGEGPFSDPGGVAGGAHDAAMFAAEGLEVSSGVDVGHRGERGIEIVMRGQFASGALDLGQIGHIGHGAAGCHVRQDDGLVGTGQDVCHLGHEMHTQKHDELGVGVGS